MEETKNNENNKEVKISKEVRDWIDGIKKNQFKETGIIPKEEFGIEIKVKKHITIREKYEFVANVMSLVFAGNDNTYMGYQPVNVELAIRYSILAYFTDLPALDDIEDVNAMLFGTGVVDKVREVAGEEVLDIERAAYAAVNAKRDYLVRKTDWNRFMEMINNFLSDSEGLLSDIDFKQITNVLSQSKNFSTNELVQAIVGNLNYTDDTSVDIKNN